LQEFAFEAGLGFVLKDSQKQLPFYKRLILMH